ncbi:acyl-CoA N-acyltransferase [Fomitopsis serialis]|uniref:acyl-CoA N-acyltransferase n=1 Tax=Fomitopsis serialis TaxID=139415 RepID=UPI0020073154|nr:acyl-CoA N-acyltransferase [Neoantrodia serialis]KAH9930000.1 acyl-CoA N-acyltransferase [Neoantrodia serialis]
MIIDTEPEASTAAQSSVARPTIRTATPDDVPALARLLLASMDTSLPDERLFPPPAVQTLCLEDAVSGEILGYAAVKTCNDTEKEDRESELDMLFVRAGMSGRGYGSMLVQAVQERWMGNAVCVRVFVRNTRAVQCYRRWGFVVVGEEEMEFGEGAERQIEEVFTMRWRPVQPT